MDIRPFITALPRLLPTPILVLACTCACASSAQPGPHHRHAIGSGYVDIVSYLSADADIDAWYTLNYKLKDGFDDICGDTFCEGDYSNIEALSYRCSVDETHGTIGRCAWVFAASTEDIDPGNGDIVVDARHWSCLSPVAPGTRAEDFLHALAVDAPLHAPLPGTGKSIYDGLIDCL